LVASRENTEKELLWLWCADNFTRQLRSEIQSKKREKIEIMISVPDLDMNPHPHGSASFSRSAHKLMDATSEMLSYFILK
jgi:hypothetical protein